MPGAASGSSKRAKKKMDRSSIPVSQASAPHPASVASGVPATPAPAGPSHMARTTAAAPTQSDPAGAHVLTHHAAGAIEIADQATQLMKDLVEEEKPGDVTLEIMERAAQDIAPRRRSTKLVGQLREAQAFRTGVEDPEAPEEQVVRRLMETENLLLLGYSKLTAAASRKWSRGTNMQLFPDSRGSTEYLGHAEASDYVMATQRTLRKLGVQTSWLKFLQANRVYVPKSTFDTRLFNSILDSSRRRDIVALVQETLASAGYTFRNLVPTWYEYSSTNTLAHAFVIEEARQIMSCLEDEVTAWIRCVGAVDAKLSRRKKKDIALDEDSLSEISATGSPRNIEGVPSLDSSGLYTPPSKVARGLNFDGVYSSDEEMPTVQSKARVQFPRDSKRQEVTSQVEKLFRSADIGPPVSRNGHSGKKLFAVTPATEEGRRDRRRTEDSRGSRRKDRRATVEGEDSSEKSDFSEDSDDDDVVASGTRSQSTQATRPRARSSRPADPSQGARGAYVIPADALGKFDPDNKWRRSEKKHWWDTYCYLGDEGGWSDRTKCKNLARHLTWPNTAWLDQLSEPVRTTWKLLKKAFFEEHCESKENPCAKYYDLKQDRKVTPREFLWELNRAARRAGLSYSKGKALADHLDRFVLGLREPSRYQALVSAGKFEHIEDFEKALAKEERYPKDRRGRADSFDRDGERNQSRDRERDRDRDSRAVLPKGATATC